MIVFLEGQTEKRHSQLASKYSKSLVPLATAGGVCQKSATPTSIGPLIFTCAAFFHITEPKTFLLIAF